MTGVQTCALPISRELLAGARGPQGGSVSAKAMWLACCLNFNSMRFDASDRADSSMVEDRRGARFSGAGVGAGAGGLSLIGLLIYAAMRFLGGDEGSGPADDPTTGPARGGPAAQGPSRAPMRGDPASPGVPAAPLTGSCANVTSASDQAKFIACVETNVQAFWARELTQPAYRPAKLVLFTDETFSGCGDATASTGPFYCPADQKVYLDLGFFDLLRKRFQAKGGDFAEAYVVAHEYGHHVQKILGTDARVRSAQRSRPSQKNQLSVRLELQADCYAGLWGHSAYQNGKVAPEEVSQALDAASAIGDDRIQSQTRGVVRPESFTHGSSAERRKWFNEGMTTGERSRCDTFGDTL